MTFPPKERQLLLTAHSIGSKMVDYLELAGVDSLGDLARSDPRELALRINAALGKAHINRTGVAALGNAIALARRSMKQR